MSQTDRFQSLPTSLRERSRLLMLGGVPSLVVHPDWERPAPMVLWMHGRTAYKEMDPGRYLRWMRAGIGACAVDLPGHGGRREEGADGPGSSLRVLGRMIGEVDGVVGALGAELGGLVDRGRLGIGGMSLGGMAALRRLCEPHPFVCAAVESTTGWLEELYHPRLAAPDWRDGAVPHARSEVEPLDPMGHVLGFAPVPLLVLHSEADQMVPWAGQRAFVERLGERYEEAGVSRSLIEVRTWAETGAPREHIGFGRVSAEAKELQASFFRRVLTAEAG